MVRGWEARKAPAYIAVGDKLVVATDEAVAAVAHSAMLLAHGMSAPRKCSARNSPKRTLADPAAREQGQRTTRSRQGACPESPGVATSASVTPRAGVVVPHYRCVSYALHTGNCIEVMRAMPAASVDAVDQPYGLKFMGKKTDDLGEGAQQREWHRLWAVEALRVLKPGGYLLAMGGSRTYHHLASGIEEAGSEIRDRILYITGAGEIAETSRSRTRLDLRLRLSKKSHDVSKAIDKAAGATRKVVGHGPAHDGALGRMNDDGWQPRVGPTPITAAATPEAQKWDGWGPALKPAHEPIWSPASPRWARLRPTSSHTGRERSTLTGAGWEQRRRRGDSWTENTGNRNGMGMKNGTPLNVTPGRWPANVILDEDSAAALDEQSGERKSGWRDTDNGTDTHGASLSTSVRARTGSTTATSAVPAPSTPGEAGPQGARGWTRAD